MGKKGVMLDNGKTAQSSMALYWKNNKNKQKNPKQKGESHLNQEQQTDKRVMSNFQKWKIHKEKAITKAYTKPTKNQQKNNKKQQLQEEAEDQQFLKRYQHGQKKKINLPGFKSKQQLSKKLQPQQVKIGDQSTNILKLPANMSGMNQSQIIQLLRSKKNRQQAMFQSKQKLKPENKKRDQQIQQQDVLLGQDFINLIKKNKQVQMEKVQIQPIKNEQQPFFKSDFLNKIAKDSLNPKQVQLFLQVNKQRLDSKSNDHKSHQKQQTNFSKQTANQNKVQTTFNSNSLNPNSAKSNDSVHLASTSQAQTFKSKFIQRVLQK